jgi:LmbE family N-acetylglucosaminyl deacetylase
MYDHSVLACYAHPDDEQLVSGLLARTVHAGGRAGLLVTTRGEAGEILDPTLATRDSLGAVREEELRRALALIGVPPENLFLLDYRDSGMAGTPENEHPQAWIRAGEQEAVGHIVAALRAFRPTLVLTFDAAGAYGHPDHIAIHRWTTAAFYAAGRTDQYPAAGPPFQPARLFYTSVPRSLMARVGGEFAAHGLDDAQLAHQVDVGEFYERKLQALFSHATQVNPNDAWWAMPDEISRAIRGTEWFQFGAGVPFPPDADPGNLFAGLE